MYIPKGAPWQRSGKATLTYEGEETFVGEATPDGDMTFLKVERAVPVHAMVADRKELYEPSQATYDSLMARLRHEASRRNQPIPTISDAEPVPTDGAKLRLARVTRLGAAPS
jgi:hypothetical protein